MAVRQHRVGLSLRNCSIRNGLRNLGLLIRNDCINHSLRIDTLIGGDLGKRLPGAQLGLQFVTRDSEQTRNRIEVFAVSSVVHRCHVHDALILRRVTAVCRSHRGDPETGCCENHGCTHHFCLLADHVCSFGLVCPRPS